MKRYWMDYLEKIHMSRRTVTLDGTTLNTLDVFDVSHGKAMVEISEDAMLRVETARNVVDRIVAVVALAVAVVVCIQKP